MQSASLKIERADHHIAELGKQFEVFVARKPYAFVVKNDPDTGQPVIQVLFREEVPINLSLIIGDTVHNLRSALDHMIWEVVGWDGGTQDKHTMLPCSRDNRTDYEGACKGLTKGCRPWLYDTLCKFQIYPGGAGELLHALNNLDVTDKHKVIRPVLGATKVPSFTIFNANHTEMMTWRDNIVAGNSGAFSVAGVPKGGYVQLDGNADCPPSIFFAEMKGGEVFNLLHAFLANVGMVRQALEAGIAKNPKV